ncbi:MAG: hypothetical protein CM15mP12_5380 [Gammaproteobacteria bacterium]|nr:MAG: hypothetical protein CM15mP12_5380 [Gammaproteobacteria bacterium]
MREIFSKRFLNKLGQAGFCVDIPEKYGGQGPDAEMVLNIPLVLRENYGSVAVGMSVHSDIVAHYILNRGSENQKFKFTCQKWKQEN